MDKEKVAKSKINKEKVAKALENFIVRVAEGVDMVPEETVVLPEVVAKYLTLATEIEMKERNGRYMADTCLLRTTP